MPEHYSWCVLQFPYLNGLIISNDLNDDFLIDYNEPVMFFEEDSIPDRDAVILKIQELMILADITVDDLI